MRRLKDVEFSWARATMVAICVAGWFRHVLGAPYDPRGTNSDLTLQYQHLQHFLYERIGSGTLPSWNPYQLAGIPAIATLQGAFYYPGNAVALFLPIPTALGIEILLHLWLAALGMMAVAARVGCGAAAALTAASVFVLRGEFLASHGFISAFEAAAWLPLVLLGVLDLTGERRLRGVVLCATATGCSLLAGNTQSTVYVLYTAGAFLVARLAGTHARPWAWGRCGVLFAGAVALGALVAAAQLVPTLELMSQGTRTTRALSVEAMFPFGLPVWLKESLFFGEPVGRALHAFGIVPLLLALAALASPRRWLVGWAIAVMVVSIGLTLGRLTPVFDVVHWLPMVSWFRPKALALPMAHAAVALLAGLGVETLLGGGTALRRAVVAVLIAAGLVEIMAAPVPPSSYAFDARDDAEADYLAPTFGEAAALAGSGRVWFAGMSLNARFATKLASRHHLRAIDDYEPLNLRRQAQYAKYMVDTWIDQPVWQGTVSAGPARAIPSIRAHRRLLDLLGLTIALVPAGDLLGVRHSFLAPAGFRLERTTRQGIELWRNPAAVPRAFTVHRTLPAPPPATLLALLASPGFDPLAASYVEGAPPDAPAADAPARGAPATIVVDGEREVVVDATLAAPGFVVLADTAYPGWRATVDDRPAPIFVTNYLFRGVPVAAGTHRVRFAYEPWTMPAGLALSAVAVMALLALAAADARWH